MVTAELNEKSLRKGCISLLVIINTVFADAVEKEADCTHEERGNPKA